MTTITEIITEWQSIKQWMSQAKERESALRLEIAKHLFVQDATGTFTEGVQKARVGNLSVKLTGKLNRSLNEPEVANLLAQAKEGKLNLTKDEIESLIKIKKELVVGSYKKLPEDKRAVFDRCLIVKGAAPELEIEEVKE